jgi:hypothetical protein
MVAYQKPTDLANLNLAFKKTTIDQDFQEVTNEINRKMELAFITLNKFKRIFYETEQGSSQRGHSFKLTDHRLLLNAHKRHIDAQ